MLLPAIALVWPGPGSLLADDFIPQSTGAGAAAILSIPAAIVLVLRKAAPAARGLTLYLVALLVGIGWFSFGELSDTFEAGRVLLVAITGLVMLLSGASLGERGRGILARGAVCISLALLVPAHLDRANGWTGVLGNTGATSEAALAGALAGAFLAIDASRTWRALGIAALALHVAYAARIPVIAGALSLAVVLAASSLLARSLPRAARVAFALIACAALVFVALPIARARLPSELGASSAAPSSDLAAPVAPGNTGGFEVRARIWSASLSMLRDHWAAGVGPGQFIARFPAYRDAREIELSTLGRKLTAETEVEHPHNDWLATILDAGVVGGACWIAFLGCVMLASLHALRTREGSVRALAAASIGLSANAFVNATLSNDAVSSSLAFAMFGCVLAEAGSERSVLVRRFVALCAAALLVLQAPRAFAHVRHGRALHPLAAAASIDADARIRALDKALDACPDSVLALRLHARALEERRADPAVIHAEWLRVLAARPLHVEALIQIGLLAARAGSPEQARPYLLKVLEIDPRHPGALQNLAVLELEDGQLKAGLDYLDRLVRVREPDGAWLTDLACRLYLHGRERESDALMQRIDPKLVQLSAEEAYALSKDERAKQHALLADMLESRAQRSWARDHMRAGRFKDAVRIYRQDMRITRDYVEDGAVEVRLELAAALLASGRADEARAEAEKLHPKRCDRDALPSFASDRLRATDWFAP
jgi:O-antigen ligase